MRRVSFAVAVPQGIRPPRGYGRAWSLWDRNATLCMPVPINFVAGMIRSCWFWIGRGFPHGGWSPRYADALNLGREIGHARGYAKGHFCGHAEGYKKGWNDALDRAIAEVGKE